MILLHADESGDPNEAEREHFVVGGIAVHESDARSLSRECDAVMARILDPGWRELEFHAQAIRKGKKPWRSVPPQVKLDLLAGMAELLATFGTRSVVPFSLFCVVHSPGGAPEADPLERVYEEIAMRFNSYVRAFPRNGGRPEQGLMIADKAKYEEVVQPLVHKWRYGGESRIGRLTRVVEVPLFLDSAASRLIQLADFVAHVCLRVLRARPARTSRANYWGV